MPSFDTVKLKQELERDEGREPKPYKDTLGLWTVGIGHKLIHQPDHYWTNDEIDWNYDRDVGEAVRRLDYNIPWWRQLTDNRQRVLINMCFNMGWGKGDHGLSSFHHTLQLIHDSMYSKAADNMLDSKWFIQVGDRADRLISMMRNG